jgi:hypothetical protein
MSLRTRSVHAICTHPGCKETAFRTCDNRAEETEAYRWKEKYLCLRHTNPQKVLGVGNESIETTLVNIEKPYGKFWDGTSGFLSGPGFMAYAEDFPPGTKLIITARIERPEPKPAITVGSD